MDEGKGLPALSIPSRVDVDMYHHCSGHYRSLCYLGPCIFLLDNGDSSPFLVDSSLVVLNVYFLRSHLQELNKNIEGYDFGRFSQNI